MWKKKYFQEKKKTPSLEENSTKLKADLDQLHEKIKQTIDNECKHTAQMGYSKEAEIGVKNIIFVFNDNNFHYLKNCFLQITRIQHETQDIRYQIDQAKLRLTTDIKVMLSNILFLIYLFIFIV